MQEAVNHTNCVSVIFLMSFRQFVRLRKYMKTITYILLLIRINKRNYHPVFHKLNVPSCITVHALTIDLDISVPLACGALVKDW